MRYPIHIAVAAAIVLSVPAHSQTYSDPGFTIESGPFAVGLRIVDQYDRTRTFQTQAGVESKNSARPLQTLVWYPATKSSLPLMSVGDYLALIKTETSFDQPEETATAKEWNFYLSSVSTARLRAQRNAAAAVGHFPIVVYSPSFSSVAWENADLCEYLASFGYVVVAAPAMGARTRQSTHDVAGALAQAKDVSFLIDYSLTLPDTDSTRVAAVGFSWGGLANLLAAAQDRRVFALVSLDGSERYFPGFVQASGVADLQTMAIPLIYFEEADQSVEAQDAVTTRFHSQGPSVLNAWHGDLFSFHMLGLFHPAFYSMSYRNKSIWQAELPHLQVADYDYRDCLLQFSWVMRDTRLFLDGYMKHERRAIDTLKVNPTPADGVPRHEFAVTFRPAAP